jgi:hypothetical protein
MALDGNFQQRHYAYASKDEPLESQYPHSISPDATAFVATESSAVGIDVSDFCPSYRSSQTDNNQ